jgi:WD repeat-containing protein 1 (actin-interacting protein 1)
VGSCAHGTHLLSLSLNGDLNYLDAATSSTSRVVTGHQKAVTVVAAPGAASTHTTLFTGSYDGRIVEWSNAGTASIRTAASHANQVTSLSVIPGTGDLLSTGMDDALKVTPPTGPPTTTLATSGIPLKSAQAAGKTVFITTKNGIHVVVGGQVVSNLQVPWNPTSVAVAPSGDEVAVGGDNMAVHVYTLAPDGKLSPKHELRGNKGSVGAVAYSPDGTMLAAGDAQKTILVFDITAPGYPIKIDTWAFHSARIHSLSWSADSKYCVSASLDTNVEVWSVDAPTKHVAIKNAHLESVNAALFLDSHTIASVGQDATVKVWKLLAM